MNLDLFKDWLGIIELAKCESSIGHHKENVIDEVDRSMRWYSQKLGENKPRSFRDLSNQGLRGGLKA